MKKDVLTLVLLACISAIVLAMQGWRLPETTPASTPTLAPPLTPAEASMVGWAPIVPTAFKAIREVAPRPKVVPSPKQEPKRKEREKARVKPKPPEPKVDQAAEPPKCDADGCSGGSCGTQTRERTFFRWRR